MKLIQLKDVKKQKSHIIDKKNIIFIILSILSIIMFAIAVSPVELQNDTFYTIKIGEQIMQNGIDMKDHFSWHQNLPYTYPHWAYDVAIYLIYNMYGFTGIFISTIILAIFLGLLMFFINKNINKSTFLSLVITIGSLYLLKDFIAARAQLVTFILFILTTFCIEKFMEGKHKKIYGMAIVIISLIIANVHVAVWPFFFILFLPYIAEQLIVWILNLKIWRKLSFKNFTRRSFKWNNIFKKIKLKNNEFKGLFVKNNYKLNNKKLKNENNYNAKTCKLNGQNVEIDDIKTIDTENKNIYTYKFILSKNNNIKYLLIVIIISMLMGFITPLKDVPFTYLYKTMIGTTTQCINEHQPLTLIQNKPIMGVIFGIIAILMLTKTRIRLHDFFMIFGLIILCFISKRQISLFVVIGNVYILKVIVDFLKNNKKFNMHNIEKNGKSVLAMIIILILVVLISWLNIKDKFDDRYINEQSYPVEAAEYIANELIPEIGQENLRLFNEYNYGSYLLLKNIPVFIDSRADLYAPEFNGVKTDDGTYDGRDIFSDFIDVSSMNTYYEIIFDKYDINYVILNRPTKLNIILCRDDNYIMKYVDDNFIVYKREIQSEEN